MGDEAAGKAFGGGVVGGLEEIGLGDAGMGGGREDVEAGGAEAAVEFEGKHDVGEFGLRVGDHGFVTGGERKVVEANVARFVGDGGDGDDAGG